jgi:hypothetical protein
MYIYFLLFPLISALVAQSIKFFIDSNQQKFSLKNLAAYSGMPSGHSAIIISLATIVGLAEGFHSPLFAVCFVLAVIVIRDAIGLRQYLGQHGKVLNILVKDLKDDKLLDENYPKLLEKIGHTPIQVLAGSMIGFLISLIGYFIVT